MKNNFLLLLLLCTCNSIVAQKAPQGAYKIIQAQYGPDTANNIETSKTTIIKIFKDGYWIGAFFGNPQKPFEGTGGGTFKVHDKKYIETLQFYSWDSTAVGQTYTFDYTLNGNNYIQEGLINSDRYKNYLIKEKYKKITSPVVLKNTSMEGVWKLESAAWDKGLTPIENSDTTEIKIYAYPRFAWAQYNNNTNQFIGAGGGTYEFDGKKLIENIEYITYENPPLHKPYELNIVKMAGGKFRQTARDGYKEIWQRLK